MIFINPGWYSFYQGCRVKSFWVESDS